MILKDNGDLDGAMRLHKEEEAICRRLNNLDGLQVSLGNQAHILLHTLQYHDQEGAMRLLKEQEAICRRLNHPVGLRFNLERQAMVLVATGDLDGAMRLHKEQEAICRRINDPAGLADSLFCQACLLANGQSRPAEGLPLAEEALRIATQHGLRALAWIQPMVDGIREMVK